MQKTAEQLANNVLRKFAAEKQKHEYQKYYSDPLHPSQVPLMQQWDDRSMGGPWPKNMVPLAGNGFGDMAVRDDVTGKLYEYLHERASKEAPFIPFRSDEAAVADVKKPLLKRALATTYDKAKWHPEGGGAHLKEITTLLRNKGLLSPEGLEAADTGVDSGYSLTSHMLTPEGKDFMDKNYSDWIKARRY